MRILFFMRSTMYVRNFESTLRLLAERGHKISVSAPGYRESDSTDLLNRLCREHTGITHNPPPPTDQDTWSPLGVQLRRGIDALRYLGPEYQASPKLRRRAERKTPPFVRAVLRRPLLNTAAGRWLFTLALRRCDRALPSDPAAEAFIRSYCPDLVLVTPLVEPGSPQSVYLRAARALGIRTGLCVHSWDNLTTKGLIHDPLDLVTVWNQAMKDEAVMLHHVPAERVIVTGAAAYDHWFSWSVRAPRQAFCERIGLRADRPYLLYLCSSKFIAYNERPFVTTWISRLRDSSSSLRDVGVLVRPHPQNTDAWHDADLDALGNVAVWPRAGGNPVNADSRSDYYDSIYHSAAVVGVNTSAQIESAIVGRSVHTLLAPEFSETQEGTPHFRHLRDGNSGLLHVASNLTEHVAQLETAVRDPRAAADRCRRFVEEFVRPYGMDQVSTPRLVDALEATASVRARPARAARWASLARPVLDRVSKAVERAETIDAVVTRHSWSRTSAARPRATGRRQAPAAGEIVSGGPDE